MKLRTLPLAAFVVILLSSWLILIVADGNPAALACPRTERVPGIELRIAAAADLSKAMRRLAPAFEKQFGIKTTVVCGSTGLLARQIENGAPFDLFMAADEGYIADLEKAGKIEPGSRRIYALGRLAIWSPRQEHLSLGDLATGRFTRIAIANPQHAPYGRAAISAFEKAGLKSSMEPKLVYGENVQQALRYAEAGSVDAAVVSLSLIDKGSGCWSMVPQSLYPPIRQALGVVRGSANPGAARKLEDYLTSRPVRRILQHYGFGLP